MTPQEKAEAIVSGFVRLDWDVIGQQLVKEVADAISAARIAALEDAAILAERRFFEAEDSEFDVGVNHAKRDIAVGIRCLKGA